MLLSNVKHNDFLNKNIKPEWILSNRELTTAVMLHDALSAAFRGNRKLKKMKNSTKFQFPCRSVGDKGSVKTGLTCFLVACLLDVTKIHRDPFQASWETSRKK